ncbi:MAG: 50S ribosomal protein L3 [bacterium]|nr:MAG: 50S ribosomal protein L3 [bacterium]
MRQTILGRKLGMSQIFDHQGNAIPVTIVQAGPCTVLQVKTVQTDGYNAIQLGFGEKKEKHTTKPLQGHFRKSDSTPKRHVREARIDDPSLFKVGQVITAGLFQKDDRVDITGTSKGKGFAGVMKRHGFSGFMASHGVHESKRGPGSIGQSADPSRVFKGMKMPGQMGNESVTVQNLKVVDVRESQNLIMVKGPVPGGKNGLLVIHHAIKKAAPPLREPETEEVEPVPEAVEEELDAGLTAAEVSEESAPVTAETAEEVPAEPVQEAAAQEEPEAESKRAESAVEEEAGETAEEPKES